MWPFCWTSTCRASTQLLVRCTGPAKAKWSLTPESWTRSFVVRDVRGIDQLTPREVCILKGVAHGQSNKAIAEDLCVSLKTIEKGITAIFEKLGPFHHGFSDRRVSVALMYLRLQSDPFGPQCNQRDLSSHELDHYR